MPQSFNPLSALADRINQMSGSAAGQPPVPSASPAPPAGAPPQQGPQLQPGMLEKLAMLLAALKGPQGGGQLPMNDPRMQVAMGSIPHIGGPRQFAPVTDTVGPLSVPPSYLQGK